MVEVPQHAGPDAVGGRHSAPTRLHKRWYLAIVYANVVLYSICWMAQAPVLPYLVDALGASGSMQYARLQTAFSGIQFIGGLVSGPLMDRYGGRWLLAVSFGASLACYGITATANSMWGLYLSRVPTVLQHAVLAARAIVTQLSSDGDRARVLGYVAVSYSVGFTVGPAIGGWLSAWSLQLAAWSATVGSALSLVMILALLPDLPNPADAHHKHEAAKGGGAEEHSGTNDAAHEGGAGRAGASPPAGGNKGGVKAMLSAFVEVARRPGVPDLLLGKLLVGLGSAVYQSMFAVLLKQQYGLDPNKNGMVMSYVGFLLLAGQALLVGPAIAAAGEPAVELGCAVGLVAVFVALSACRTMWQLLVLMVPYAVAGMLYSNASTSRLTKAVLPQQRGTALAIDMSLSSGVRMLSPTLGAAAADRLGHQAVPLLGAGLIGLFLVALQLGIARIPLPTAGRARWRLFGGKAPESAHAAEAKAEGKED
ncbi:hypothetical protein HYH02_005317 [Chlamydomonas schloesseri]|uniref:Major facilitator superfamily (MFS) profile domain-containing protein n=1 Tax=Chlamydomonas schloesseri TaxID=2026947 RepID=A0A835WM81_9CHLO|nr:hypothetical protein HYH02_005317 [Chlamydomonas schloesseri]|eukprot:KAG2449794.1 hypothetical protein HYH02_005317 [Chlamydomonas schloesseri]